MTRKIRFGVEQEVTKGWVRLAIFDSEDEAIKLLQHERYLDTQAVRYGWITKPQTYRLVVGCFVNLGLVD